MRFNTTSDELRPACWFTVVGYGEVGGVVCGVGDVWQPARAFVLSQGYCYAEDTFAAFWDGLVQRIAQTQRHLAAGVTCRCARRTHPPLQAMRSAVRATRCGCWMSVGW